MRYFITLLILFGCLDGYSQKVAVRLNALPATDGAFGAGVSYGIGNKKHCRVGRKLTAMEAKRNVREPLLVDTT